MKTVQYTRDPNNKPQLSEEQEAYLKSLSDDNIDYSDIEELNDEFLEKEESKTEETSIFKRRTYQ